MSDIVYLSPSVTVEEACACLDVSQAEVAVVGDHPDTSDVNRTAYIGKIVRILKSPKLSEQRYLLTYVNSRKVEYSGAIIRRVAYENRDKPPTDLNSRFLFSRVQALQQVWTWVYILPDPDLESKGFSSGDTDG